jgi:hypothetical protein
LLVGAEVFAALILLGVVLSNRGSDPAVSSVVVQANGERETIAVQNVLQLVDNRFESIVKLWGLSLAGGLVASQAFMDVLDQTLDICQLAVTRRRFNAQSLNLEGGDITLDDLLLHVHLVLNDDCVRATLLLNLTGRLDRVVLEVAVRAFERLEDDIAEVGDADEQQSGFSL